MANSKNLIIIDDNNNELELFINKHEKISIFIKENGNTDYYQSKFITLNKDDAISLKRELSKLIKLL
jgi:hypothetical protein